MASWAPGTLYRCARSESVSRRASAGSVEFRDDPNVAWSSAPRDPCTGDTHETPPQCMGGEPTLIQHIVPPMVRVVEGERPPQDFSLFPEELAIIHNAAEKRRRDFRAGRA